MGTRNKVIIADDEKLICTLLTELIQWDELNLELIGVANDGVELFEMIQSERPDIVITDIGMPRMDGIELIREVREREISCHFVIVSGYRLFEYARNALKYNVEDYILKPIDQEELNTCLQNMSERVSREKAGAAAGGTVRSGAFSLEQFIEELTPEHATTEEVLQRYGIAFSEGQFIAASIQIDHATQQDEDNGAGPIMQKLIIAFHDQLDVLCSQVLVESGGWSLHAAINFPPENLPEVYAAIDAFFFKARDILGLFRGIYITIGLGSAGNKIYDLKQSFEDAEIAVWARIHEGQDRIIRRKDLLNGQALSPAETQSVMANIRRAMESFDRESFMEEAQRLFSRLKENFYAEESRRICMQIMELFLDTCSRVIEEYSNEAFLRSQMMHNLKYCTTPDAMESAVTEPICSFIETCKSHMHEQKAHPIHQAMNYVEANYGQALRLQDVAEAVMLNPTYFSNLFKKETGQNFCDYLTDVRIRNARQLLQQTNMNIAEIAERVGYPDSHYFSKVFQKSTGLKPSVYRKIYG